MTPAAVDESSVACTDIFGRSWEGRRATVVGLGKSGAAAAALLRRVGCEVRLTEGRDTDALRAARTSLEQLGVVGVELGGHSPGLVEGADVVVVSPGVPETSGPVRWALAQGIPILSEIDLAFHFCPAPVVGVTGTNGKSTAATLIAEIVQVSGRPAVACGNLGTPFSSVIPALTPATVAVVEISSFQLLWCHALRPKIAVFLNFGTNHLDRHADPQAYLAAKARLFQRQTPDDWAVLNGTDPRLVELSGRLQARCVWFGENRTNPVAYRLAAETRRALTENAQAVLQVARLLGVADPLAWQVIRAFRGLEHRLEDVATVRGVRFVNDSKSTTPESLVYALSQVRGRVVVILGGRDKGMDFTPLKARLAESRVAGVVLIGESRSRLRALANGSEAVRECGTLEEAVGAAAGFAGPGTTVLFSPACASFDMFQNFEERGSAFKAAVARLLR